MYTLLSIRNILRSSIPKNGNFDSNVFIVKNHKNLTCVFLYLQKPSLLYSILQRITAKKKICNRNFLAVFWGPQNGKNIFFTMNFYEGFLDLHTHAVINFKIVLFLTYLFYFLLMHFLIPFFLFWNILYEASLQNNNWTKYCLMKGRKQGFENFIQRPCVRRTKIWREKLSLTKMLQCMHNIQSTHYCILHQLKFL